MRLFVVRVVWLFLFPLYQLAYAQSDVRQIDLQIKKIVTQSLVIRTAFDQAGVSLKTEQYLSIWENEYAASDLSEVFKNTIELWSRVPKNNDKVGGSSSLLVLRSVALLTARCEYALQHFDEAKRVGRLPAGVLDQLDIQSANIREACELMNKFSVSP